MMKLSVDFYELDNEAQDVKAGSLCLEGGKVRPSNKELLIWD